MNERVRQMVNAAYQRMMAWWQAKNSSQRLQVGVIAALALAVLVVGLRSVTSPNWQPLYTNLTPQVAGQITNQLTQMKVPYQLANQGRTVLVPAKAVNQARVSLATQNVPNSGTVTMPNLTQFSLGETDQQLQIQQQVATQQELADTINSIAGVKDSRVLINQPAPALFGESQNPATASVFIDLNPGASLSTAQVQGIMNLVAHAVQGLSTKQISVVDQNGTLLSAAVNQTGAAATVSGLTGAELAATNAEDQAISSQVQTMLDQVLGPGAAVVRVNATLNFNTTKQNQTQYSTGPINQQEVQAATSTGGGTVVAAAGTTSNVPTYPAVGTGAPTSSSSSTKTTHYDNNVTQTTTSIPSGSISRLTVAVAVDQQLSTAQQQTLKSLVSQAAGISTARGDVVTVAGLPFNKQAVNQALTQMNAAQRRTQIIHYGELGAGVLALVLLALWGRRRVGERAQLALPGGGVTSIEVHNPGQTQAAVPVSESSLYMDEVSVPENMERAQLRRIVEKDPESVARVLHGWIAGND